VLFSRRQRDSNAWVRVYRGTGPTDAYLVRDWLGRNQVPAQVRGEGLMSLRGDIPIWEAWPAVWVPTHLEAEARELVSQFDGPTLVHPAWRCGRCGEENAPNFASCWSCGADRPVAAPDGDGPTG
jgi:hypothetical protein